MQTPRRKNIRLKGFDYSQEGIYFITIVTKDREPLFGGVVDGEMMLNEFGEIVDVTWKDLVNHNPNIGLGEFGIMPTHVHGIIAIFDPVGAGSQPAPYDEPGVGLPEAQRTRQGARTAEPGVGLEPTPTKNVPLSEIVRQFKTFSAKRINTLLGTPGVPVWQRNYFDRIIRSEREYENIAAYIANNPANWGTDEDRTAPDW